MNIATPLLEPTHIIGDQQNMEMWVQEALYGHRFTSEQRPFMLVLEALAICRGRWQSDDTDMFPGLPSNGEHETLYSYIIAQKALRYLLFWRALDSAATDAQLPPEQRMDEIVTKLERDYPKSANPEKFSYLKKRVDGNPDALLQAIEIIRGSEINPANNKRPQSRFLNPQGPSLHLTELNNQMTSNDRRFFARGGELVYLMLNRSNYREVLSKAIAERFFRKDDPIDKIARSLIPDESDERTSNAYLGYLPQAWMPVYDRLAEDWLAILNCSSLPRSQLLGPLSSITSLGVVRYFGEVGQERFGIAAKSIPLDVSDGALRDIRDLGKMMLIQHREAIHQTTRTFIDQTLERNLRWQACLNTPHPNAVTQSTNARMVIEDVFRTKFKDTGDQARTAQEWHELIIERSSGRIRADPSSIIQPLARAGGFAASRPGVGRWFAGSDAFLEALVHANVAETPLELEDFARLLYERYGLIIGPAEATEHLSGMSLNQTSFRRNFLYLEERLAALGLLKRLSDDCAFVHNPFARETEK